MAAQVLFKFPNVNNANKIFIPTMAISSRGKNYHVYVVNPEGGNTGVVEKRAVSIGRITNEGLEITEGLSDGEIIITAGLRSLNEGQRVRLDSNF